MNASLPKDIAAITTETNKKIIDNNINGHNKEEITYKSASTTLLSSYLPPLLPLHYRIYLIRHGETDWNLQGKIQGGGYDIPLNENGIQQAKQVAQTMIDIPLNVIASSSLARAKTTADIVFEQRQQSSDTNGSTIHRIVDSRFNEMRFGEFEGYAARPADVKSTAMMSSKERQYFDYFKETAQKVKEDYYLEIPGGGESTKQVHDRSIQSLMNIIEQQQKTVSQQQNGSESKHIAIVAHGRTNKVLIAATALGNAQRFVEIKQSNTAINVLDYDTRTGQWTERLINHIEHVKDHVILREYPHHQH